MPLHVEFYLAVAATAVAAAVAAAFVAGFCRSFGWRLASSAVAAGNPAANIATAFAFVLR